MEKYGRAGQATDGNITRRMGSSWWRTKATVTLRIYNTYCFSTATIFVRMLRRTYPPYLPRWCWKMPCRSLFVIARRRA